MFLVAILFMVPILAVGIAIARSNISFLKGVTYTCIVGFLWVFLNNQIENTMQTKKIAYELQRIADKQTGINSLAQESASLETAKNELRAILNESK